MVAFEIRFVNDKSIPLCGWSRCLELRNVLNHLNSIPSSIQFIVEKKNKELIPVLDLSPTINYNGTLGYTTYRKSTHTNRFLTMHHPQIKSSACQTSAHDQNNLTPNFSSNYTIHNRAHRAKTFQVKPFRHEEICLAMNRWMKWCYLSVLNILDQHTRLKRSFLRAVGYNTEVSQNVIQYYISTKTRLIWTDPLPSEVYRFRCKCGLSNTGQREKLMYMSDCFKVELKKKILSCETCMATRPEVQIRGVIADCQWQTVLLETCKIVKNLTIVLEKQPRGSSSLTFRTKCGMAFCYVFVY